MINIFYLELGQKNRKEMKMEKYRLTLVKENEFPYNNEKISCSDIAFQFVKKHFQDCPSEKTGVLYLDIRGNIISFDDCLFKGTINFTAFSPREILQTALLCNAYAVLLVHNHPSGDPNPSKEDKNVTENLRQALRLFDMKLTDHLIIGEKDFFSFADNGLIINL